jgi:hypothetical protein
VAAPTPAAPAQAAPTPAPAGRLKGVAAMNALAGNTITGKIDGSDYVVFFAPNGELKMQVDSEVAEGKWQLKGEQVCFVFEDEDDECYRLEVEGETAFLFDEDAVQFRMKIEKGNSAKL